MRFLVIAALLGGAAAKQAVLIPAGGSWTYDAQEDWPGECRNGWRQSPIDISTENATPMNLGEMRFHYDTTGPFNVTGTGKMVRVYGFDTWDPRPYIEGGGLDASYTLDEIHFHWHYIPAATSTFIWNQLPVSEHSIDGTRYPVEIHLVHRGQLQGQEHIAVVAVFAQCDRNAVFANNGIDDLFMKIAAVNGFPSKSDDPKTEFSGEESFKPEELLPANRARFYRYEGSLTTPNCDEVVTWTVMEEPISIPYWLLIQLVSFDMWNGPTKFVHNLRRPQALNGRRVVLNDPNAPSMLSEPSSAAHSCCAFWPLVTAIAALLIVDVKVPDGIFF